MIPTREIYTALLETVRDALADAGMSGVPVVAGDLDEPVVRPSVKLLLDGDRTHQATACLIERELTAFIYFFPQDEHRWRAEHFALRDALRAAFCDCLMVDSFEIPVAADGVTFDRTDDVLIAGIPFAWQELLTEPDGETMDDLNLTVHP